MQLKSTAAAAASARVKLVALIKEFLLSMHRIESKQNKNGTYSVTDFPVVLFAFFYSLKAKTLFELAFICQSRFQQRFWLVGLFISGWFISTVEYP
jgi:hypothetical protein